ncbi:ArnT family glycosyltransferase [Kitasatospora brasiliensis]|uniref:ArnT family glycosyltransferase n=1 Tax=Kitasatospora brasiliensis TaxID=3058040 RepID=UPI0029317D91|nr:glycosyltransferase family 39 protein [Kitasatospora sp. K002]
MSTESDFSHEPPGRAAHEPMTEPQPDPIAQGRAARRRAAAAAASAPGAAAAVGAAEPEPNLIEQGRAARRRAARESMAEAEAEPAFVEPPRAAVAVDEPEPTPAPVPSPAPRRTERTPAPAPAPEPESRRTAAAVENPDGIPLAPYTIPEVPAIGWDPSTSPRRRWIARGLLGAVLTVQAALSLRLLAAAHPDEAATMVAGRQQLDHLLHGTPVTTDLVERIQGSPWLYPPLAGAAANADGIWGTRLLSLGFALITTVLLYSLTRRLFNERVAICAIGVYAVLQSTVVVGFYAAPESLALLLVALAAWTTVFTARRHPALALLAAPPAALACAVAYSAAFAVPALVALAFAGARPYQRTGPAALRALLAGAGTLVLLLPYGTLGKLAGWSPSRGNAPGPAGSILLNTLQWAGLFTVLAVAGTIAYARREQMNEHDAPEQDPLPTSRGQRALLGTVLTVTALLIPAAHLWTGTSGALFRHLGYGALLAAPLAGVGLTRLVGAHFRHPQLGILVWVALLALGLEQSALRYQNGPDSGRLLAVLRVHTDPQGHYLTEVDGLAEYYLGGVSKPEQWVSARTGTEYRDAAGAQHHGDAGSVAAIRDGWFSMVVLDSTAPKATDRALSDALTASGQYRLIAQFTSPTGDSSTYKVYLKH